MKTTLCDNSFMSFDIRIEVPVRNKHVYLERGKVIKNAKAAIKNHSKTGRATVIFIFDIEGVLFKLQGDYVSIVK